METKTGRLAEVAANIGLCINTDKTKMLGVNNRQQEPVELNGKPTAEVDRFVYLGSIITKDGGKDQDVSARFNNARFCRQLSSVHMELTIPLSEEQNQTVQHQHEICPPVYLENMASHQDPDQEYPGLRQQMPPQHLACQLA